MSSSELRLVASGKVGVHADLGRNRVMISCETEDGKSIRLAVDLKTLEKLHQEIQKQLEPT
jgi:hypothetical protein